MTGAGDLEPRLVDSLQPIRYAFLANVLYAAMRTGLLAELSAGPLSCRELAARKDMDEARLAAVLTYLRNEGYLDEEAAAASEEAGVEVAADEGAGGRYRLTDRAREIQAFEPWYALLVGGYAGTIGQLGSVLAKGAGYATRNGAEVGRGSCGISQYDAIPLALSLLRAADIRPARIIDLGCGDGEFLMTLAAELPGVRGIGLDPEEASIAAARRAAASRGMADRIDFVAGNAADPDWSPNWSPNSAVAAARPVGRHADCYLASFVLQEILEQEGEHALVGMLRRIFEHAPDACLLVIEVDYRAGDPATMGHPLALAYYNPYYLLHELTEQRLETRRFWEELFATAGLTCLALDTTDPAVDSTGLELGFLLVAA